VNNFMSSNAALVTLWGGLVGGPDQNDAFPDVRNDYKMSEGKWVMFPAMYKKLHRAEFNSSFSSLTYAGPRLMVALQSNQYLCPLIFPVCTSAQSQHQTPPATGESAVPYPGPHSGV